MQKVAAKAGIDTETWLQSVVIEAPKVLPDATPDVRQRVNSAITAWALDLSAGHPTRYDGVALVCGFPIPRVTRRQEAGKRRYVISLF